MKIDWHRQANPDGVGAAVSVLQTSSRGAAAGLESARPAGLERGGRPAQAEGERLERLADALKAATPAVPDNDRADIKNCILSGARSGLAKAFQGEPAARFTLGEHVGLEAVILTNGERPALFVKNGFVDLKAADIGDWDADLGHFRSQIRKVIRSVGRINAPLEQGFAGTCFVIADGLVLTNRHVLEEIATQGTSGAWTLNWPKQTTVDFFSEDGSAAVTRFTVTGVAFAGPDPIKRMVNFAHLDMAILRVDPASDKENDFPRVVTFATDVAAPGAKSRLYVVGFPGRPRDWLSDGVPDPGHETAAVLSSVFNDRFGVKRLAPGKATTASGKVDGDAQKWICAHDASTLGGNSGSCVVDLNDDGSRIMALHFAGLARARNWAHVAGRLHDTLKAHGAKFVA